MPKDFPMGTVIRTGLNREHASADSHVTLVGNKNVNVCWKICY